MANEADKRHRKHGFPWRTVGWSIAALLLLLPLAANAPWTVSDFIFAALLIGFVGVAFELTVRVTRNWAHRGGVAFALAATFLTIWANGAVGMIGDEDNPYNLLFLGVIGLALAGAVVARFRPAGMTYAMAAAAVAQVGVAAGGLSSDLRGAVFSAAFAGLWLLAAALFWVAAGEKSRAAAQAANAGR